MILRLHKSHGFASDFSGPALATLAGAAASGLLYYLVRRDPARLDAVGERVQGWLLRFHALRAGATRAAAPAAVKPIATDASLPGMETASATEAAPKARDWIHAVHEAMEREPRDFGFDKLDWNAPLLSEYLQRHHGESIPVNRIRDALKQSGYQWQYSRYRKVRE